MEIKQKELDHLLVETKLKSRFAGRSDDHRYISSNWCSKDVSSNRHRYMERAPHLGHEQYDRCRKNLCYDSKYLYCEPMLRV